MAGVCGPCSEVTPLRLRVPERISDGPWSEREGTYVRERLAVSPHAPVGVQTAARAAEAGGWVRRYLRNAMTLDAAVALLAGLIALRGRFDVHGHVPAAYLALTIALPLSWVGTRALAGAGMDQRI